MNSNSGCSSSLEKEGEKDQKIKEDKEEKEMAPVERFRSLARSLQANRWTKALQSKIAEEYREEFNITQQNQGGSDEILSFNVIGKQIFCFYTSNK